MMREKGFPCRRVCVWFHLAVTLAVLGAVIPAGLAAAVARRRAAAGPGPVGKIVKFGKNPVLDVGAPGRWDEGRTGCFSVEKAGGTFYLWYMGCGKSNTWRIGLATSADGVAWKRSPANPVLPPGKPGRWDDRQVSMPYVLKVGDTFHMWYTGSGKRGGGFGLARSPDGVRWKRHGDGPVMRGIGGSMDPCVRKFGDQFVMWYCGRLGGKYRILRATSPDGVRWTRGRDPVLPLGKAGDFDSRHHAGPVVLKVGRTWYLFHLGSNAKRWSVGAATSPDGVRWEKSSLNPVLDVGGKDDWDGGSILSVDVLRLDGRFHLWYAAHSLTDAPKAEKEQKIRIGYATSGPPGPPKPAATSKTRPTTPPLARSPLKADQARKIQQQWAKHVQLPLTHTNSIGMKLMLVPPGEFTMGWTEKQFDETLAAIRSDPKRKANAMGMVTWSMLMMPAHRVRITKPFYLGACEVTVGQFRQFARAGGYKTEAERGLNHGKEYKGRRPMSTWRKPMAWRRDYKQHDDEPVLHLCWNDCAAFCKWLSETEGRQYALPTEAQWEYACRAGTTTPWHFGGPDTFDRLAHQYAWWSDGAQGKHPGPRRVALGKPNAFGLYDMHGNVWEYVADWWHRLTYKESPINDPTGPAGQSEKGDLRRIIRGSSFDWGRWGGDSAYRMRITQRSNQHPHMGFRVAVRVKGVRGAPPAADPDRKIRLKRRDPGADSAEVAAALAAGAAKRRHPKELTIDLGGGVKMEFVLVPAGSFLMGSNKGAKDEQPIHRTVISRPFYAARFELTQSQWEAVMGKDKRLAGMASPDNDMTGPRKAMNALSWVACRDFIRKLSARAPGHAFCLPTEAQWEYACRAGSTTEFCFGDDAAALGEYAWFEGNMIWPGKPGYRGRAFYHDTGKKKPNAFGLYDMHGGVWEWCLDRYDPDYYLRSPLSDPKGPASGRFGVLRGGSWFRYAGYARSAYRRFSHPECDGDGVTAWILDFGCRIVINLDEKPAEKK